MVISVISAVIIVSLTILLGQEYGATGLMAVYAVVYGIIGVGCGSFIFLKKRAEWENL
jgi:hypothetical protein